MEKSVQTACAAVVLHITRLLLDPALVLLSGPSAPLTNDGTFWLIASAQMFL